MWAALWNFQGQAWAGWELSILSWMVLFRPLRLLQRLDEPLSVLVHKVCLCSKIDRGSSSLCSSLRGLSSTIQLRIDSSQPAQACPWKFHNAAHTTVHYCTTPMLPAKLLCSHSCQVILWFSTTNDRTWLSSTHNDLIFWIHNCHNLCDFNYSSVLV